MIFWTEWPGRLELTTAGSGNLSELVAIRSWRQHQTDESLGNWWALRDGGIYFFFFYKQLPRGLRIQLEMLQSIKRNNITNNLNTNYKVYIRQLIHINPWGVVTGTNPAQEHLYGTLEHSPDQFCHTSKDWRENILHMRNLQYGMAIQLYT